MNKFPVIRFSNFENKWDDIILSKLFKFSRGRGYAKKDLSQHGEFEILLYGMLYTNYKSKLVSTNSFTNLLDNSVMSKGNEIVIPSSGETSEDIARATAICSSDIILASDMNILTPIDDSISTHFIALLLTYGKANQKLIKKAQGNSVVHIYNSDLKNIEIMIPTFEEQTQIGNFFQKLDELIELQQATISNLEKMKKGIQMKFLSERENTKIEFKDLSESSRKKIKLKDVYKFYRGKHIGLKDISTSGENKAIAYGQLYTTYNNVIEVVEGKSDKEGTIGIKNDLLFPTSSTVPRGTSQATALMVDNVQIGGDIIIARPKENNAIDSRYFSYMISANRNKIFKIIEGTTIAHIYAKDIGKLEYEISEFKIQKKIASFLLNTEHLIELEQTELELLQEMKKGFLQKMFV